MVAIEQSTNSSTFLRTETPTILGGPGAAVTVHLSPLPTPGPYVLNKADLWSPYLGLQFSAILLTIITSEVARYFRLQRRHRQRSSRPDASSSSKASTCHATASHPDRPLVKGMIIALVTILCSQTIFAFYAGLILFVKEWGSSHPRPEHLLYSNMISDAAAGSVVHALYSWQLFKITPSRQRWAAWLLAIAIMTLSAAQLACSVMAAIGYGQSAGPIALSQSDVKLVRSVFRAWLGLCSSADAVVCIAYLVRMRGHLWNQNIAVKKASAHNTFSRRHQPFLLSVVRTIGWIFLPANGFAVLTTVLALSLEMTAPSRDYYSWLLVCLAKIQALGVIVCLNLRDTDGHGNNNSPGGTSIHSPHGMRDFFITSSMNEGAPSPILIKRSGTETSLETAVASSTAAAASSTSVRPEFACRHRSQSPMSPRAAFEEPVRYAYKTVETIGRSRTAGKSSRDHRAMLPIYSTSSAGSLPSYTRAARGPVPTASSVVNRGVHDDGNEEEEMDAHSTAPSTSSDVTLAAILPGALGLPTSFDDHTDPSSDADSIYHEKLSAVPAVPMLYMAPAGAPPTALSNGQIPVLASAVDTSQILVPLTPATSLYSSGDASTDGQTSPAIQRWVQGSSRRPSRMSSDPSLTGYVRHRNLSRRPTFEAQYHHISHLPMRGRFEIPHAGAGLARAAGPSSPVSSTSTPSSPPANTTESATHSSYRRGWI